MRSFTAVLTLILTLCCCHPGFAQPARSVEKGRDVGDGMVLCNYPFDPAKVKEITFVSPTVDYPCFEIVIPMGDWNEGKNASIQSVTVNDATCDSYYVFVDGSSHVQSGWITNRLANAKNVVLVVRSLWSNHQAVSVGVKIKATDQGGQSQTLSRVYEAKAPASGGGLEGWHRYQSFVAREKAGLDRTNEPVEFSITVRAEDCADLSKELRVCELGKDGRTWIPLPFQTFNAKDFQGTPPGTSNPNYLQHPSKSIEVICPLNVAARKAKVCAVFYDNPAAPPLPPVLTDLQVAGPSLGATVENWYYGVKLSGESGQIASFDLKPANQDSQVILSDSGFKTEKVPGASIWNGQPVPRLTNSQSRAVHWNPDSFSDNGMWGHTFSWNPPDHSEVTTRGPLLFRITNSGRMPGDTPQVDVSVTYSFYPGQPYVLATTLLKVRDTLNASAIRDGEIVLDSHLITNFVWKEKTGEIQTIRTLHGANWQDEWGYRVDPDVPWIAMTNELDGYGVGTAILSAQAFNPTHGEATLHRPAFYLYYHHFWNTPLTYFTRAWVYPFSDYQRGPILPVTEDSQYYSKAAFMPFLLHKGHERYSGIDGASQRLLNPLEVRWGR